MRLNLSQSPVLYPPTKTNPKQRPRVPHVRRFSHFRREYGSKNFARSIVAGRTWVFRIAETLVTLARSTDKWNPAARPTRQSRLCGMSKFAPKVVASGWAVTRPEPVSLPLGGTLRPLFAVHDDPKSSDAVQPEKSEPRVFH